MTTVTIGGRELRIGATYGPKFGGASTPARTFVGLHDDDRRCCISVRYRLHPPRHGRVGGLMSPRAWSRWAGNETKESGDE